MDREPREGRPPAEDDDAGDFKLAWSGVDDAWTEAAGDKGEFSPRTPRAEKEHPGGSGARPVDDVPWDELADDTKPQFEEESFQAATPPLVPDDDEDDAGPKPDDEAPPHGDPLDDAVTDEGFEHDRPSARMDSLQDALASIRERVQSLSGSVQAPRAPRAAASQLALYRAATDDRTLAELRRHGRDTEELLRRLSALMQDLSLDLRSIVDAARRAIDQTSEQAESSIELGRLLGERIEQMDDQLAGRIDAVDGVIAQRIDQIDAAVGSMQVHLDKRLTRIEQRAGVGVVREELSELRADVGDLRSEVGTIRDEGVGVDAGAADLQERLEVLGTQLDRTLTMLRDLVEGSPEQDEDMVDGVVAAIKTETEAAVEPFRTEVEELGRQLGDALDREEQLGATLATLTDEVQRLRKRIAVRSAPPTTGSGAEFLTTFTVAVPEGTPAERVAETEAQEAQRARELAHQGHLLRLWKLPAQHGASRALGLWRARDGVDMQVILKSLPMDPWMEVETTPLTQHPNDPATSNS